MFSSSSRSESINSPDGTHLIFCYQCGEPISRTINPISRALCVACLYIEEHGEALPEDVRTAYQFSKANVTDVSLLVVKEEQKIYNSLSTRFTLRSMGGNMLQALGFRKRERPVKPQKTLQIVEQKQRQGLFTSTELGLGLSELDKKLNK